MAESRLLHKVQKNNRTFCNMAMVALFVKGYRYAEGLLVCREREDQSRSILPSTCGLMIFSFVIRFCRASAIVMPVS